MTTRNKGRFTVITNDNINNVPEVTKTISGHSNPFYEKLLNFRNLQEHQKKRFTVEELLKW